MKHDPTTGPLFSPSDLATFAGCRHAARLDRDLALRGGDAPDALGPDALGPDALGPDANAATGRRPAEAYARHLRDAGRDVVEIAGDGDPASRARAALEAMRRGAEVIVRAPLADGAWRGVADALVRRDAPSDLGGWSYEVQDAGPAGAHVEALLRLALYSGWLGALQGRTPERFHIVSPDAPFRISSYRVDDYAAYARRLRARYERFLRDLDAGREDPAPEPVEACATCRWRRDCERRWREAEHLSLVADLGREHRRELERRGIDRVSALAEIGSGLPFRPEHGRPETYLAAAHQARLQVGSRDAGTPLVELLPDDERLGLARLPEPNPADLFFALEGAPLHGSGGLEYLWGWTSEDGPFEHAWALDPAAEREAFAAFIDRVTGARERHPGMHAYHYGVRALDALKRLASRHAVREEALDRLLRAEALVDLKPITRRAARIGVEAYELADLERVHGYRRRLDPREAAAHERAIAHALASGAAHEAPADAREAVLERSRDDVRSLAALRAWLEAQRRELHEPGADLERPVIEAREPTEERQERRREAEEVAAALREGLPADPAAWSDEQRAYALLAAMIDFEHREEKVGWWEFFAHASSAPDDLERGKAGVAGMRYEGEVVGARGRPAARFRIPPQDLDVKGGEAFHTLIDGEPQAVATLDAFDPIKGTLDLRMKGAFDHLRPRSGFFQEFVPPSAAPDRRLEFARDVLERGLDAPGPHRVQRDLLLGLVGRGAGGALGASRRPGETTVEAAARLARSLDGGVLPIQGPPGAGKTYTAARMIVELVRDGRKVAVTAISNKVISNLLEGVLEAAREAGVPVRAGQKASRGVPEGVTLLKDNDRAAQAALRGELDVIGGTTWLWTRPAFEGWADHLVIDEAGQMSLAAAISNAAAARNVVLLGDPQQLEQPIRAAHPDGADVAALRHLIGDASVLAPGRGLFLDETWRLAPAICRFTSEVFYERALRSVEGNERIALSGDDDLSGTGFRFVRVPHDGRAGWCPEEAEVVDGLVRRLMGRAFRPRSGAARRIGLEDVLVVAPFNRQVRELERRLPDGARVGTVDRFQGQEAPVVIFSMGVSSAELAPRGLSFLFSGNRLNVASSRAQALAVLVANERLFDAVCRTPDDMRLLNAFARLLELGPGVAAPA